MGFGKWVRKVGHRVAKGFHKATKRIKHASKKISKFAHKTSKWLTNHQKLIHNIVSTGGAVASTVFGPEALAVSAGINKAFDTAVSIGGSVSRIADGVSAVTNAQNMGEILRTGRAAVAVGSSESKNIKRDLDNIFASIRKRGRASTTASTVRSGVDSRKRARLLPRRTALTSQRGETVASNVIETGNAL